MALPAVSGPLSCEDRIRGGTSTAKMSPEAPPLLATLACRGGGNVWNSALCRGAGVWLVIALVLSYAVH